MNKKGCELVKNKLTGHMILSETETLFKKVLYESFIHYGMAVLGKKVTIDFSDEKLISIQIDQIRFQFTYHLVLEELE